MPKPVHLCNVPGCEERCRGHGYCSRHYQAWRKYGDPLKVVQKQHHGLSLQERFELYIKRTIDCWEWIGHRDPNGYGRLNVDGYPMLAHRLSYQLRWGGIPDGMAVLHKCDNPRCVNPEHLFLGTQSDNANDMYRKGRSRKRGMKGTDHHQAKLSEADVRAIRTSQEPDGKVGAQYGISRTAVNDIRKRRSWAHIE